MHDVEKENLKKKYELELLKSQVEIQKQTAENIGREIHDSVTQKLTLASIFIQKLHFEMGSNKNEKELETVIKILSNALQELRHLSKDLTGGALSKLTLMELIGEECDLVNNSGKCIAKMSYHSIPEIDVSYKISILRIVQEFIQNSMKHSKCKTIQIIIFYENGNLVLDLMDDGIGYDMKNNKTQGVGLGSIERRAAFMGGTFELTTALGEGFRCKIIIPLNDKILTHEYKSSISG